MSKYFSIIGQKGDLTILKRLLKVNEIHQVIFRENVVKEYYSDDVYEVLSSQDIDILNAVIFDKNSAFSSAGVNGHLEMVRYLFEQIPSLRREGTLDDYLLLKVAAKGGFLEDVKALLGKKEFREEILNPPDSILNAIRMLEAAVRNGRLNVVEYLLTLPEISNNVHLLLSDSNESLYEVARKGYLEIGKRLLLNDTLVDTIIAEKFEGISILEAAARAGQLAMVDHLLSNPKVLQDEFQNHSALWGAIEQGGSSIIFRLLHAYKSAGIEFPSGQMPDEKFRNFNYDEFYENFPRLLMEAREALRERLEIIELAPLVEEYAEVKGEDLGGEMERVNLLKDYDFLKKYIQEKEARDRAEVIPREERARREAKEVAERAQSPQSHVSGAKPKGGHVGKLVEKFQRAIDEEDKERAKKGPGRKK